MELNVLCGKCPLFFHTYIVSLPYLHFLCPATFVHGVYGIMLVPVTLVTHSFEQDNSRTINMDMHEPVN